MSIEVIAIRADAGVDLPCPFQIGDHLHISELTLIEALTLFFRFSIDTKKVVVVDEFKEYQGHPLYYSRDWFVPLNPPLEETKEKIKTEVYEL